MIRSIDDRCTTLIYDRSWDGNQLRSPYRVIQYSWDMVVKSVANPIVATHLKYYGKHEDIRSVIPLWSFYVPFDSPTKFRKDGHPSGCAENMKAFHCLQIDYDSGEVSIMQFIEEWKPYVFALYTSPSHSNQVEKFRVIIPLPKAHSPRIFTYKSTKEYMTNEVFEGCDVSTIDSYRKQRMPSRITPNSPYKYYINSGNMLYDLPRNELNALMDSEDILNESKLRKSESFTNDNIEPLISSLKEKMINAVKGTRNRTYYSCAYCLSQHGMNGGDIYETLSDSIESEMESEFRDICTRF